MRTCSDSIVDVAPDAGRDRGGPSSDLPVVGHLTRLLDQGILLGWLIIKTDQVMNRFSRSMFLVLPTLLAIPACNSSRTAQGGALGAGAGAGIGAIIGNQFEGKNGTAIGAIIGAAVGGTTGALIGRRMDKQAEELRNDLEGATVTRVGEGIKITFDSGLLFAVDQSALTTAAKANIADMANTLQKYEDTEVLIEGHTDADGSEEHNMDLSRERADSVKRDLLAAGLSPSRLSTVGYGETQPMADNGTAAGKAENRRVEIAIYADRRMKKAAERGEFGSVE